MTKRKPKLGRKLAAALRTIASAGLHRTAPTASAPRDLEARGLVELVRFEGVQPVWRATAAGAAMAAEQ